MVGNPTQPNRADLFQMRLIDRSLVELAMFNNPLFVQQKVTFGSLAISIVAAYCLCGTGYTHTFRAWDGDGHKSSWMLANTQHPLTRQQTRPQTKTHHPVKLEETAAIGFDSATACSRTRGSYRPLSEPASTITAVQVVPPVYVHLVHARNPPGSLLDDVLQK